MRRHIRRPFLTVVLLGMLAIAIGWAVELFSDWLGSFNFAAR